MQVLKVLKKKKISKIAKLFPKWQKKTIFTIIGKFSSHGVGLSLHEEPKFIPPYYDKMINVY